MCGLAGILSFTSDDNSPYIAQVGRMADSVKHRGPDNQVFWSDERVFLGFDRLSIIDLSSSGNQPMTNEDNSIVIVFNGEIYNFKELLPQLQSSHIFVSHSDTEVLIHGYEQWGLSGLLGKIEGMFAFCLYDRVKKEAYLVRDRIGKKPLYYWATSDFVAFASETKAFFTQRDFVFDVDQEAFDLWLGFPYLPDNEKTLISGIRKVPPAHYLTIKENNGLSLHRYWQISYSPFTGDFAQALEQTENLLLTSIRKRLVADVPVGILLSGGLDSSLIAALAKKEGSHVRAINISFSNSTIDESPFAQKVADYCGLDLIKLQLNCPDLYQSFKENIWIFDDLSTYDSGLFSTYLMSQRVKETGIKVLLTGEGADEVFGGYTWFGLSKYPFSLLPQSFKSLLYYYAIMRVVSKPCFLKYASWLNSRLNEQAGSFFEKLQRYEIQYSLPNHYCMKLDKGSSAASVEARTPYLAHYLVELACNLPDKYKMAGDFFSLSRSNEKFVLREVAKKYLPEEICQRKKKGGMFPLYQLLEIGLEKERELILNNPYLVRAFGRSGLERLLPRQNFKPLIRQREWLGWKCLVFALWFDYYSNYGKN
ncbi:asparagine synthase (glutamine-hydrolyzing) [candidate division WWE3 bacterium CG08_land_8_20_14_0_20_43_13]|uniref:asparagine synthase (glutamine-hydrolyzing) n=1 Tax=candidate division WWE3 bacterium CG08_land_8_20_14_0_20_43_13 TaxID=1975087 RepID=A0A2H0X6T1_UNCKA|nr:MAG: asparagine synthase (glutamine-hydrolyzing) [candidate division WWE3 bacterium CG08_land_8_20_14_0_20_43_13]